VSGIKNKRLLRYIPAIVGVLAVGGVASGMVLVIQHLLDKPPQTKKFVQQISLIKPPPPPPKIEKPPEPEVEEVKIEEPEQPDQEMPETADDLPPAGDLLGLDADGVAGLDAFGLLGKKGGRGLLQGTEGDREFTWYANRIQDDIYNWLSEKDEIRKQRYSIVVDLWINQDGSIRDFELVESSGNKKIDKQLAMAFSQMGQFSERPPTNIPQPIKVKINSRL
jgi:protein TonB